MSTSGKDAYVGLLQQFLPAHVSTRRVLRRFAEGNEVCSIVSMPAKSTLQPDQARLLGTVRGELSRLLPACDERRMFGGVTIMLNGNLLCCVARQGLMVRVGAEGEAAALARPAAQPCMGTGRRMAGFVMVDHDGLATPQDVVSWLRLAHAYVKTLPPKPVGKSTPK